MAARAPPDPPSPSLSIQQLRSHPATLIDDSVESRSSHVRHTRSRTTSRQQVALRSTAWTLAQQSRTSWNRPGWDWLADRVHKTRQLQRSNKPRTDWRPSRLPAALRTDALLTPPSSRWVNLIHSRRSADDGQTVGFHGCRRWPPYRHCLYEGSRSFFPEPMGESRKQESQRKLIIQGKVNGSVGA